MGRECMLIKRTTNDGANDFATVYRPCTVDEVVGQEVNKKLIKNNLSKGTTPHCMLFTGPPGCGKTTVARVVALGLNCESVLEGSTDKPCLVCNSCVAILNQNNIDVTEVNVGRSGGKDAVDKITQSLAYSPLDNRSKTIIFDEAQKLTPAAQDLLLKPMEDGYEHVYFIFCTNEPEKLKKTFLDRCRKIHFGTLSNGLLVEMLKNICDYEGVTYDVEIINYIVEVAKGVPRVAIERLKLVIDEASWNLDAVKLLLISQSIDEDSPNIMEIGKLLTRGKFKEVLKVLKLLKNVPEETIRIATAGFFINKLKWCKLLTEANKLSGALDILTVPILMSGKPAHHVLVNNFYKVCRIMRG